MSGRILNGRNAAAAISTGFKFFGARHLDKWGGIGSVIAGQGIEIAAGLGSEQPRTRISDFLGCTATAVTTTYAERHKILTGTESRWHIARSMGAFALDLITSKESDPHNIVNHAAPTVSITASAIRNKLEAQNDIGFAGIAQACAKAINSADILSLAQTLRRDAHETP
jgi:hypothetical protein